MPYRYLHLAAEPPGFHLPDEEPAPTAHLLRPVNIESGDETLPDWLRALPARPTVYVTLGTVHSQEPVGQALFPVLLETLRDEPLNVVVTVGRANDPDRWGPQPENVHIAQFIPQSQLLPFCDIVVTHGGFGTVTGALNAGLPMVLLPILADQPYNTACCAHLGTGLAVTPEERTPDVIRSAVREVLTEPSYRAAAERLRGEIASLPGPEHGVALLERLATERQPILAG
jgi:MGT family glycosyltransferase